MDFKIFHAFDLVFFYVLKNKLGLGLSLHIHVFFSVGDKSSVTLVENNPGRGDEMEVLPSMEEDLGRLSPIKSKCAFIYIEVFCESCMVF